MLTRFLERSEAAVFEAIVHRHGPMVWGVCRRVLRDHHDAEDAYQATFLVLARKAASVVPREKLGNWLYGVAHRTAMKARMMRAKRRGRESQVPDMPQPTAGPQAHRDDLTGWLDEELSRLPEKYRTPLVLCELEERSHREAAAQLSVPIGTVSSRLSRARSMLAKRLARRGLSLSAGSLAVLLAQESASASMPTRLIGPTARAASETAAGAPTAGAVSAGVAALSREVLKMMLLSKIKKVATAMLMVVSALAAGGAGLSLRDQAEAEPSAAEPAGEIQATRVIDAGGYPYGVHWSHDGKTVSSSVLTSDRVDVPPEERAWDASSGRPVAVAATPGGTASPDGRLRATSGRHDERPLGAVWHVTISDVTTGRERATIRGTPVHSLQHSYARDLSGVIFSPDSRFVVTGQFDGRVGVWDAGTGELVRELLDHEKNCTGLTFTAGGKILLTSSTDGALCVYESRGWTLRHTLEHKDEVASFSPVDDGRRVVTCAGSTATVWSLSSGKPETVVTAPGAALRCVAVRADGKRFAAGTDGEPGTIWVWDTNSGQVRHTLTGDLKSVIGVAFSPDGKGLACGDAGKKVRIWRLPD